MLDDETDAGTAEAGPEKDPDDETLLRRLKRWEKQAKQHWSSWREEARLCYDFVAGKQWSADDKAALLDQMRQPVTFNRVAPMVDAVTGAEILNRQEVRYSAREQGDVQVNEIITAADEWSRDLADTEDEESDMFADTVICGMGWTETLMKYDDDPEGRIVDDRVDPLEMWSDPQAKKRCLADARFVIRGRFRDKDDLPPAWRKKIKNHTEGEGAAYATDDIQTGSTGPRDDYEREDARGLGGADADRRQVWVRHFQWFDKETAYRISDEATGQAVTVDKEKLRQISQMYLSVGMKPPEYAKIEVNKYKQAILIGDVVVEQGDIEANAFTFKCVTGKRDRNANIFFGVVRAMMDPQMWGNKFFVQIMHIINTAAKGGLLYEAGSFANPRKALDDWSKPDAAIELQRGALSGQKPAVQERQPTVFPVGLDKMMQFALENLPQTSGINLEMLGLVERDQPGVLEAQRKKAGYAILAVFFDSLRRYRKMKGRVRLFFIQNYISDGRLIKIKGENSTEQYVPLMKQKDAATYDVVVDDAPMSPNQKETTWMMMQAMMPMLAKMGVPPEIWQIMLEYSPLPSSVSGKINQVLTKKSQEPPPPDPEMVKIQAQAQADQAKAETQAQADQAKVIADAEAADKKAQLDAIKAEREFEIEKARLATELEVEKAKLAIKVEESRQQMLADQQKHTMQLQSDRMRMGMEHEKNQMTLDFEGRRNAQDLAFQREQATGPDGKPKKRKIAIKRDKSGRMSELTEG